MDLLTEVKLLIGRVSGEELDQEELEDFISQELAEDDLEVLIEIVEEFDQTDSLSPMEQEVWETIVDYVESQK